MAEGQDPPRQVAVVTGGGQGIGRSIALALAGDGFAIAVAARRAGPLEEVVAEIEARGAPAIAVVCDVTDPESVIALQQSVQHKMGSASVLINNAGIAESHKFVDHPDDLWQRMLEVNLTGTYRVSKVFVPGMIEQRWGRIVNIASTAAKVGARYLAAYTASKHGVLGLTRALAAELGPHNITVNAICPGYVDTPMTQASIENIIARTGRTREEALAFIHSTNPQGRLIHPEEVAQVARMLVGRAAGGISGQSINVDGGAVMF